MVLQHYLPIRCLLATAVLASLLVGRGRLEYDAAPTSTHSWRGMGKSGCRLILPIVLIVGETIRRPPPLARPRWKVSQAC